ncbi:MAG: FkbM family methyltransferase [Treponema sp.]|jgi:hypothetical protein|nr:FkbM family methyltransferase [Treponema sp.]
MTLKRQIKKIVKWFTPYGIVEYRRKKLNQDQIQKEKEIVNYFNKLDKKSQDHEIMEIVNYFENNPFSVFPYNFMKKYRVDNITVYRDEACKMKYVLHEKKRMYFPKNWDDDSVRGYYNGLLIEQDTNSPHRYEDDEFHVNNGDILADIGAAEGLFALSNIEKASKVCLFECDVEWIGALTKTFEPWMEKVRIINKYISDQTKGEYITLDDFLNGGRINFIKADIEGSEIALLKGAKILLSTQDNLQMVLCTYHRENDAEDLKKILLENGFDTRFTKRYMIFIFDKSLKEPYLRRGIIRAMKKKIE